MLNCLAQQAVRQSAENLTHFSLEIRKYVYVAYTMLILTYTNKLVSHKDFALSRTSAFWSHILSIKSKLETFNGEKSTFLLRLILFF